MNRSMPRRIGRLYSATRNTVRGLAHATRSEAALQEELAALAVALPVGLFAAPSVAWYVAMIGALLLVITVELLNTGIEKLADHVSPGWNREIGIVKDIGSAAVFFALLLAILVWGAALGLRLGLF
jgi:diacylglycerol kinase (ATP)